MGPYHAIRDKIVELLEGVTLDASSAFTTVSKEPRNTFDGYPAATVVPSRIDSDYLTVAQNQREYGFAVSMYYPLSETEWSTAIEVMLRLTDACLDVLDQSIDLDGVCDFLRAVPAEWEVVTTTQDSSSLAVTLNIVAIKSVDVR